MLNRLVRHEPEAVISLPRFDDGFSNIEGPMIRLGPRGSYTPSVSRKIVYGGRVSSKKTFSLREGVLLAPK